MIKIPFLKCFSMIFLIVIFYIKNSYSNCHFKYSNSVSVQIANIISHSNSRNAYLLEILSIARFFGCTYYDELFVKFGVENIDREISGF